MKAIVIARPGGPEVLELREVPTPEPARGEVRVRVRATAINRADLLQRMGLYAAPPDSPQEIPGLEFAGVIDSVGEGVREWRAGDRVFGLVGGGAYAEALLVPARALARIPDRLGFDEAAAVPEAFVTAWDAMVTQAQLAAGETVLVSAVGSGVGTAAVQLARAIGARSIGTARTADKLDRARALGLDEGIEAPDGKFAEDLACVRERARLVVVGLMAGPRVELDLAMLLHKRVWMAGTVLRARPLEEKIATMRAFARHVVPLLASGALRPVIDRVLPLSRVAEAHAYVASNTGFGKTVLSVEE
jgi:NADPH:quinone reductase-like Zn-dependent oxidoreductase